MAKHGLVTGLVMSLCLLGCGSDKGSDGNDVTCPGGAAAGSSLDCMCDDGASGTQLCQDDGTLSTCTCGGGDGTMTGDGDGTMTGDGDGTMTGDGDGTMTGDGDGMTGDGDGTMTGDGDGATTGGGNSPGQLAVCESDADCDGDLACYGASGTRLGYCSTTCETSFGFGGGFGGGFPGFGGGTADAGPADGGSADEGPCAALTGATYACAPTAGICRIECTADDDSNCPDRMECVNRGGAYRCLYEESVDFPPGPGAPFDACERDRDCNTDLVCSGTLGYCAEQCAIDSHCTAGGMCDQNTNLCVIACSDEEPCSNGLSCQDIQFGFGQILRCVVSDQPAASDTMDAGM